MCHILILPSWYPAGPSDARGVFFRDQALALAEFGHRVGVAAVNMKSIRFVRQWRSYKRAQAVEIDEGIATYRRNLWAALPRVPYGNYKLWKAAAESVLERYVEENGMPDLIHAHCAVYAGIVAKKWGRRHGIPVVLTEHSSGFACRSFRPWQLKLAEEGAVGADACIAVSPALGWVLDDALPRARGRWTWVPNVVGPRFCPEDTICSVTERPKRLLNLGAMKENKGQADLLDAFSQAFGRSMRTAELWVGGSGPLRHRLEAQAQELGLGTRVRFLGHVAPTEVPSLMAQVDAVVVASHYETFGVVAAEALMAGVPVVATRCGGPESIVGEGDGHLVPPRDVRALARGLVSVIKDGKTSDRRAIAARAKARFSSAAVGRQLTELYQTVLCP